MREYGVLPEPLSCSSQCSPVGRSPRRAAAHGRHPIAARTRRTDGPSKQRPEGRCRRFADYPPWPRSRPARRLHPRRSARRPLSKIPPDRAPVTALAATACKTRQVAERTSYRSAIRDRAAPPSVLRTISLAATGVSNEFSESMDCMSLTACYRATSICGQAPPIYRDQRKPAPFRETD